MRREAIDRPWDARSGAWARVEDRVPPWERPDPRWSGEVPRWWNPRVAAQLIEPTPLAVRARAVIDGRLAPSIDDVLALAHPVLRHRMALNFAARADGVTLASVIDRLCEPYR